MRKLVSFLLALLAATGAEAQMSGTGFFVSDQGHIVTSHHVVENALEITAITMKGERLPATLVRADREKDLAILRVTARPQAVLAIRPSAGIRRGERVYALGYPQTQIQGEEVKVTDGLISSLSGMRDNPLMFQITNPIQPGNSGGPLLSDEGQVVGVVTSTLNAARVLAVTGSLPQNVNYAMKSSYLLDMLERLPEVKLRPAVANPPPRKFVDVLADAEPAVVRLSVRVDRSTTASSPMRTAPVVPPPSSPRAPAGYQVVRIGHAAPLSGPQAHFGRDNDNGVRMAVDEINARGTTIGGRKVWLEVVSVDDAAEPARGTQAAERLCTAGVAGVVGHLNSGTSIPASRVYNNCGIPHLTPSATNPALTRPAYRTTFRLIAPDDFLGTYLANTAADVLSSTRVAVISDGSAYGTGVASSFARTALARGLQVVAEETVRPGTEFDAVLQKLRLEQPHAIFYSGMDDEAAQLLLKMQAAGLVHTKLLGPDGICTSALARKSLHTPALDNVICAEGGLALAKMPGGGAWKDRYERSFPGQFQVYSPYTYDATYVLFDAMVRADSTDPAVFMAKLRATHLQGVTGVIAFDDRGELRDAPVTLYRYRAGKKTFFD